MSDTFPFERELCARFERFEPLFRAPAGLLAWARASADDAPTLLRVLRADSADAASTLRQALQAWIDDAPRVRHPALLHPTALLEPLGDDPAAVAVAYPLRGEATTLAALVLHGPETLALPRLLGQLVPLLEGIEALHAENLAHGALAPAGLVVESIDDLVLVRAGDIGLERVIRPLEPREALGAGPSAQRRGPANMASDVRSLGHLLGWLHAAIASGTSALGSEPRWPAELTELASRATRKRPIRIGTLVSELKRILALWDGLAEAPAPDASATPLRPASGAIRGSLVRPRRSVTEPLHLRPGELGAEPPEAHEPEPADDAFDDGWAIESDELDVVAPATPAANADGAAQSIAEADAADDETTADANGDDDAADDTPSEEGGHADDDDDFAIDIAELETADTVRESAAALLDEGTPAASADEADEADEATSDVAPEAIALDEPPAAPSEPPRGSGRRRALPDLAVYGYALSSVLGFNAAGERVTYRGRRLADDLEVVAKRLGEVPLERIADRVERLREVDHPRIAALVEVFEEEGGHAWLVQHFVDRPSVASRSRWSADALRKFADAALELFEHLGSLEPPLVHGDVKPENLLVDAQGRCILVDVGHMPATLEPASRGTPGFAAPEQLRGEPLAPSSDLYGLGATLVSMIAGLPGYRIHELVRESASDGEGERAFDLSCLPAGVSGELQSWLGQLVASDPARRFRSALAARNALAAIELGEFEGAPEPTPLIDPKATQPLRMDLLEPPAPLYAERSVDPRGKVERVEHALRADVICEEPAPRRSNGALVFAVVALVVLTLIGLIFWRILASEPSASNPAAPEGEPRALVDFAATPPHAEAVHAALGLLAVCNDESGTVYETASASVVHRFWPDAGGCRALAFGTDGTHLLVAGHDGGLRRHDLSDPAAPVARLEVEAEGEVTALVALSAERVLLEERGAHGALRWRVANDARSSDDAFLTLPRGAVVCDSPGRAARAWAVGQSIELVAPDGLRPLRSLPARGRVLGCALSPDGIRAAAVVEGFGIQQWRMASGSSPEQPVVDWPGIDRARAPVALRFGESADVLLAAVGDTLMVTAPAFSSVDFAGRVERLSTGDGDRPLVASAPGRVIVTTRDGLAVADLLDGASDSLTRVRFRHRASAFTPRGDRLLGLHSPRRGAAIRGDEARASSLLTSWDLAAAQLRWSVPLTFEPYAIGVDPSATTAVLAERQGTHHELHTFALADGAYGHRVDLAGRLEALDWSLDGRIAVATTVYAGSEVFLHDAGSLTRMHQFGAGTTVAWYRDDLLLVWDEEGLRGQQLGASERSAPLVRPEQVGIAAASLERLATHPFGRTAVLYGPGGAAWVDLSTRRAEVISQVPVEHVAFSDDGSRFLAGDFIYASDTGEPLLAISALAPGQRPRFDAHGRRLVAASGASGEGAIWDATTGARLATLSHGPLGQSDVGTGEVEVLGWPGALHPGQPLMLRDRAGVASLESLERVQPEVVFGLDGAQRWAIGDGLHVASAGGSEAPVVFGDGFHARDADEDAARQGQAAVRARLEGLGLATAPRPDPLADAPALVLPQLVTLAVETDPPGATVRLELAGEPPRELGRTPLSVELESIEEAVTLVLERPGFAPERSTLTLSGDVRVRRALLDLRTRAEADAMSVDGPLVPEAFASVVQRERRTLRLCTLLDGFATLATSAPWAQLRVVVGADGRVRQTSVAETNLGLEAQACLESAITRWTFEHAPTGSVVSYRVDLSP